MKYFVTLPSGIEHVVDILEDARGALTVSVDGEPADAAPLGATGASHVTRSGRGATTVQVDGHVVELWLEGSAPDVGVIANGSRFFAKVESERMRIRAGDKGGRGGDGTVKSPMPGRVVRVLVAEGDEVHAGQPVVVVEAMKMENELAATTAGKVAKILVAQGATVEGGAPLVEISPS
ncbi:MAG: biotin/lipoyl-containing protein [Polyangiaceae bacterium]